MDAARQRLDLTRRVAAGDDDAVKQGGEFGGVDDFDVFRLDVFECVDSEFLQFADIHSVGGVEVVVGNIVENGLGQQILSILPGGESVTYR